MTGEKPGLRARKRAATERAIENAALALVAEHGYEHVTVDMICEASMVSQRTFFNYFGSKEGVILGKSPVVPTPEIVQEFVQGRGSDVVGELVRTIASAMTSVEPDLKLLTARRRIIQQNLELVTKENSRMGEAQSEFRQWVLDRFAAQGRVVEDEGDLDDEARMVVVLALAGLHWMMQTWAASNFELDRSELLERASALIARITSNAESA